MAGKGSNPRPRDVDRETFAANWNRIFSNKRTPEGTGRRVMNTQDQPAEYAREIRDAYVDGSVDHQFWQQVVEFIENEDD